MNIDRQITKERRALSYIAHINHLGEIQSCQAHSQNAAEIARDAMKPIGLSACSYLAALLHDCGKFTDTFTDYIRAAATGEQVEKSVIHSFAGVRLILSRYHPKGIELDCRAVTAEIIAYAIGAHHGQFDITDATGKNGFRHRIEKQPAYDVQAIENFLGNCISEKELDNLFERAVDELTPTIERLCSLAGDNDEILFYIGLLARLIASAVAEGDRSDTAAFMSSRVLGKMGQTSGLWRKCLNAIDAALDALPKETPIHAARRVFSDACLDYADQPGGIYQLNLPTGGGKTLASLRYAVAHAEEYGKTRIIYVAPLLSIIEQNASVIRRAINNDDIILEHHSASQDEQITTEDISAYELSLENWNKPIIVTTLVRLLYTLFKDKMSSVRRFLALCNSVIIIDEVQTVPRRMLSMFNLAMNFLSTVCNTTIILCSATQPTFDHAKHPLKLSEERMPSDELIKCYAGLFKRTRIIPTARMDLSEISELIRQILSDNDNLLVVCNTKYQAEQLYTHTDLPDVLKFHLSAGMCMAHRKDELRRLDEALRQRKKLVCISTQIIEAGVDISFDCVIRLLAGLDNVVQSAGRCNRNGESESARPVYVVQCSDEDLRHLKEIKEAQDAMNMLLAEYSVSPGQFDDDLSSSKSVSYYYERLFDGMKMNAQDYPINGMGQNNLFSMLAMNEYFALMDPCADEYFLHQAFRSAGRLFEVFDEETRSVIVPYGDGKQLIEDLCGKRAQYDLSYLQDLMERAKEFSVSLHAGAFRMLTGRECVVPVCGGHMLAIKNECYDIHTGVIIKPREGETECSTLIL